MDIKTIIHEEKREELSPTPESADHADHMLQTSLKGYPKLAADHLLHEEMQGRVVKTVGNLVRRLNLKFGKNVPTSEDSKEELENKVLLRHNAYEVLIETAMNLIGIESDRAGFTDEECEKSLESISETLESWEDLEIKEDTEEVLGSTIAEATVDDFLEGMKRIQDGTGMVAQLGEKIEGELESRNEASSFVSTAGDVIQNNIYYQMTQEGMCKFGNDYAVGLRWLRHLGYVQVSTNPTLAAKAFDDFPELWEVFKDHVEENPEWLRNPGEHSDEIGMEGTIVALLDNLKVFAPVAFLSDYQDGLVSYQLNPNISGSVEESIADALTVYSRIRNLLETYNKYLFWGYATPEESARPNVVFKVAGSSPAATEVTAELTSLGIGTNDTVVYSVPQEGLLITQKFDGMARAINRGISPTQTYETNMGGRLERHLRDVIAEDLLSEAIEEFDNEEEVIQELAENLGCADDIDDPLLSLGEKIRLVTTSSSYKKNMKFLTQDPFVEVIAESGICGGSREETLEYLEEQENTIRKAGIYVTRRVYEIFFSSENRKKWIDYLQEKHGVTEEEAEEIMSQVDVLPASKRRPDDTYETLAEENMTHTEFPSHQADILETSRKEDFDLTEYRNSVLKGIDEDILEDLYELEDFRKAYELNKELKSRMEEAGIDTEEYGDEGLEPEEWPSFGPAAKTMRGFTEDYNDFRDKAVRVVQNMRQEESEEA